jgi:Glycosyl transferase family 2
VGGPDYAQAVTDRWRSARRGRGTGAAASELATLRAEVAALRSEIQAFAGVPGELGELRRTVEDGRDLLARTYDRLEDGPAKLGAIRAAPDYDLAWDEPSPLVSVVIATYEGAEVLCERALPSVQAQTHERWEALVVGDATEDDTEERVAALGDDRVRFVNLPVRGPYPEDPIARWRIAGTTPLNEACRLAHGRWIAPLGHDDAFDDDHLSVLLELARSERAEFAYGQMRTLEAVSARELPYTVGRWPPQFSHIGAQAAIYHRGLAAFPWDTNARFSGEPNDWQFVRRLWEAGARFAFLERAVTSYFYAPKDPVGQAWVAEQMAARQP